MQNSSNPLHSDLFVTQKLVYEPSGLVCTHVIKEAESEEYGAYTFDLNNRYIKFRVAKITPTKIGQFVTLWKRIGNGPILPYDMTDPIDLYVISVRTTEHFGQFVFPKAVLGAKDIVSKDGKGGKRALRVYPPWDVTDSPQASRTQAWQLVYFFEINPRQSIDATVIQRLYT